MPYRKRKYNGLYVWEGASWQKLSADNETLSPHVYKVTDTRDGEVYLARNFGTTAGDWMLENIRYDPLLYPDPAFANYKHSAENSASPHTAKHFAYPEGAIVVYYPDEHPSATWKDKKKNGLLYNWAATANGQNMTAADQGQTPAGVDPVTTPIQGICPSGWHVPSDKEWNDLEREIYNNAHLYSTYTEAEKNTWTPWLTEWEYGPYGSPGWDWRPSAQNIDAQGSAMRSFCPPTGDKVNPQGKSLTSEQGGFNMLLVGYGSLNSITYGSMGFVRTSSTKSFNTAYTRQLWTDYSMGRSTTTHYNMSSVRCKK